MSFNENKTKSKRKKYVQKKSLSLSRQSKNSFYSPIKSISITKTDQGEEGTCLAHACAHLVVKNVFEPLYPLKLSKKEQELYNEHSCNEYLKTHKLMDIHSIQECSIHGYYKILLFLYVYFTAYENFISKGKKQFLAPIVSFVLELKYIPKIFDQSFHSPMLLHFLKHFKKRIEEFNIVYNTVDIDNGDVTIIRKILDGGFYVAINLEETISRARLQSHSRSGSTTQIKPLGHTSTIVGHTPSHFIVKNSWDEILDYISYKELDKIILMYTRIRWKIKNFFVVLPIYGNMELYDGYRDTFVTDLEIEERELSLYKKWIFDYISKFKKLI